MDAGAHGVIVPMVNSKTEAEQAVRSVKYPPLGNRGVGLARAQGFGMAFDEYKKWLNINSIAVVQIEHFKAIENLEEILSVKNIDATIIGPYDLSASIGHPGEFDHPEVIKALDYYKKICKKMNMAAGFHVIPSNAQEVKRKIKEGFKFVGFSLDEILLGQKVNDELEILRGEE